MAAPAAMATATAESPARASAQGARPAGRRRRALPPGVRCRGLPLARPPGRAGAPAHVLGRGDRGQAGGERPRPGRLHRPVRPGQPQRPPDGAALPGGRRAPGQRAQHHRRLPYFPYGKGDKKDEPRVSIRARVVADALEVAGTGRVLTVDLHAGQLQGFFHVPVDNLYALPVLAAELERMVRAGALSAPGDRRPGRRAGQAGAGLHAPPGGGRRRGGHRGQGAPDARRALGGDRPAGGRRRAGRRDRRRHHLHRGHPLQHGRGGQGARRPLGARPGDARPADGRRGAARSRPARWWRCWSRTPSPCPRCRRCAPSPSRPSSPRRSAASTRRRPSAASSVACAPPGPGPPV